MIDIHITPRIMLLSSAVALLLFSVSAYAIHQYTARTKVNVQMVPEDSRLFIDDQEVNGDAHYLELGTYTFTAKKEGYKDYRTEVEVVSSEDMLVGLAPYPDSVDAYKELEEDEENHYTREALGSIESNRFGMELRENYPITSKLPYISIKDLISVTYGNTEDDDNHIFIQINSSSTQGRKNSANWILKQGVELSELDIRYGERYVSPLVDREKAERGY